MTHGLAVNASNISLILSFNLGLNGSRKLVHVVLLGGAFKLAVPSLPADVTVLVILQGAIQGRQFPQLQPLVLVARLVCRN